MLATTMLTTTFTVHPLSLRHAVQSQLATRAAMVVCVLPGAWTQQASEDGKSFFHNTDTGETVWQLPPAVLPEPWVQSTDDAGTAFFYNSASGESLWELPESVLQAAPLQPPLPPPQPAPSPAPLAEPSTPTLDSDGSPLEVRPLTEENAVAVLNECMEDIGTMFGTNAESAKVGITGLVEFVELDGPTVVVRLKGRFWHQRSRVVERVSCYVLERIPECVDVIIEDAAQVRLLRTP